MIEMLKKRREDGEEGFTLIELMVVVLIIGILLAIAVPTFLKAQDNAKSKAAQSNLRSGLSAAKTVYADTSSYASTAVDASVLRQAEPSLQWATTSSSPETIGFTASSATVFLMAVKSKGGDCFFLMDNVSTDPGAAGTWYARVNGESGACTPTATGPAAASGGTVASVYVRDAKVGWK